ncbi:MAG: acyl-CoA dehydrogenase family protein [Chloroflexi bacterium]|nr:acyl-CoA dehydrogenase family protein [Chloroflexota bacterium]
MRFEFTSEDERFRAELRALLAANLPAGWTGPPDEADDADWALSQRMRKAIAARGWLVMHWPAEYGGQDASPMRNIIFAEEMAHHRAPGNDRFGTRMIGPVLMRYGSDEQKRKYLPDIAAGGIQWCQGYSEPDAGSDLASLKTRAVLKGDRFVVNGAKIWTSLAHRADMMFMLVRTDPGAPKHRGISMLLADMNAPGVEVRPIINMSGSHSFNQVTFDDVEVPVENLVGDLNNGWRVGMSVLNYERSGVDYVGWGQRAWDELAQFCREESGPDGRPLSADPAVRRRMAELDAELEGARLLTYEVAWHQQKGEAPAEVASMSKLAGTVANRNVLDYGMRLLGMYGVLEQGSAHAKLQGRFFKMRMYYTSGEILAGTTEIQKNLIAWRGLELPRV